MTNASNPGGDDGRHCEKCSKPIPNFLPFYQAFGLQVVCYLCAFFKKCIGCGETFPHPSEETDSNGQHMCNSCLDKLKSEREKEDSENFELNVEAIGTDGEQGDTHPVGDVQSNGNGIFSRGNEGDDYAPLVNSSQPGNENGGIFTIQEEEFTEEEDKKMPATKKAPTICAELFNVPNLDDGGDDGRHCQNTACGRLIPDDQPYFQVGDLQIVCSTCAHFKCSGCGAFRLSPSPMTTANGPICNTCVEKMNSEQEEEDSGNTEVNGQATVPFVNENSMVLFANSNSEDSSESEDTESTQDPSDRQLALAPANHLSEPEVIEVPVNGNGGSIVQDPKLIDFNLRNQRINHRRDELIRDTGMPLFHAHILATKDVKDHEKFQQKNVTLASQISAQDKERQQRRQEAQQKADHQSQELDLRKDQHSHDVKKAKQQADHQNKELDLKKEQHDHEVEKDESNQLEKRKAQAVKDAESKNSYMYLVLGALAIILVGLLAMHITTSGSFCENFFRSLGLGILWNWHKISAVRTIASWLEFPLQVVTWAKSLFQEKSIAPDSDFSDEMKGSCALAFFAFIGMVALVYSFLCRTTTPPFAAAVSWIFLAVWLSMFYSEYDSDPMIMIFPSLVFFCFGVLLVLVAKVLLTDFNTAQSIDDINKAVKKQEARYFLIFCLAFGSPIGFLGLIIRPDVALWLVAVVGIEKFLALLFAIWAVACVATYYCF